jgi:hypothetical protein
LLRFAGRNVLAIVTARVEWIALAASFVFEVRTGLILGSVGPVKCVTIDLQQVIGRRRFDLLCVGSQRVGFLLKRGDIGAVELLQSPRRLSLP